MLDAEHFVAGAVGAHAGQPVGLQRAHPIRRHGQQFRVLDGHQRANEVEGAALDPVQVLARVVALVEGQGDRLGTSDDLMVAPGQIGGETLEQGRVGAVAGIGAMQQGRSEVGRDQQRHADDAQRPAALLAVAALGQLGALVEGVESVHVIMSRFFALDCDARKSVSNSY